jgi:hypothetical protein
MLSECKQNSKTDLKRKFIQRKILCEDSKKILKKWLYENIDWPYPSIEVIEVLSVEANLSVKRISRWFINERKKLQSKRQTISNR